MYIGTFSFFGAINFDYLFPQFFKTHLNSALIKCRNELRKPAENIFLIKKITLLKRIPDSRNLYERIANTRVGDMPTQAIGNVFYMEVPC